MEDVAGKFSPTNNSRQVFAKVAGFKLFGGKRGSGIQLGIGWRGFNPKRVSQLSIQDAERIRYERWCLGYPESYYSPS